MNHADEHKIQFGVVARCSHCDWQSEVHWAEHRRHEAAIQLPLLWEHQKVHGVEDLLTRLLKGKAD